MAATKTKIQKRRQRLRAVLQIPVPGQRQEPVQVRQAQEKREPKGLLKLLM